MDNKEIYKGTIKGGQGIRYGEEIIKFLTSKGGKNSTPRVGYALLTLPIKQEELVVGTKIIALVDRPHGGSVMKNDIGIVRSIIGDSFYTDFPKHQGYIMDKKSLLEGKVKILPKETEKMEDNFECYTRVTKENFLEIANWRQSGKVGAFLDFEHKPETVNGFVSSPDGYWSAHNDFFIMGKVMKEVDYDFFRRNVMKMHDFGNCTLESASSNIFDGPRITRRIEEVKASLVLDSDSFNAYGNTPKAYPKEKKEVEEFMNEEYFPKIKEIL